MAKEKVERLAILKDTLRELYLKSGNQCAFPGCTRVMLNADGIFIGQLCHIEAAEEGGQRFNADSSNEDRRAFSNLMLMCYEHHVITNDVKKFTVPVLQNMKAEHEAKFTDVAKAIEDGICDESDKVLVRPAKTLAKFNQAMEWNQSPEELADTGKGINWTVKQLQRLPIRTRQLLVVIVNRLERVQLKNHRYRYENDVLHKEIVEASALTDAEVVDHVKIMEKYDIAYGDEGEDRVARIYLREPRDWLVLAELREFCGRSGIPLAALIVDLRFDLLD